MRDAEKHEGLDAAMKSNVNKLTSNIITKCIPDGLVVTIIAFRMLY